jgi:predicted PurR-regulated permease PerM
MSESRSQKVSTAIILASVFIILAGLMAAKSIVIPLLLALFIGVISAYPIRWITSKRVPHWLAVIIVLLGIFITLFFVGGVVGNSVSTFTDEMPKYKENIAEMTLSIRQSLNRRGIDITEEMGSLIQPDKAFDYATIFVSDIGAIIGDSLLILFVVIFMLFEMNSFPIKMSVVEKLRGGSLKYFKEIGESIRHYLAIKTVISLLTGFLVTICTLIIGLDYPVLWGMIAFLLNYIPSIGSIIAAIPAVLLALVQLGVSGMVWTGIIYLAINTLMGNIIEPRVMGKGLGLSTLIVFVSLIVWGFIFGSIGMFLSVPLTMSIKIILEQNPKTKWLAVLLGTEKDAVNLRTSE